MESKSFVISPHFGIEKLDSGNVDDLIDVFEDRIRNFHFKTARALSQSEIGDADYAILQIVLSLVETYHVLNHPRNVVGDFVLDFVNGLHELFPEAFPEINDRTEFKGSDMEEIYHSLRCGLYHWGFTRNNIGVVDASNPPIQIRTKKGKFFVLMNSKGVLDRIEEKYSEFIVDLRRPSNEVKRDWFKKVFEHYGVLKDFLSE